MAVPITSSEGAKTIVLSKSFSPSSFFKFAIKDSCDVSDFSLILRELALWLAVLLLLLLLMMILLPSLWRVRAM
jgi:hypothetical protein